ncbi:hypothetical protein GA0070616_0450 [Micromonospora nigra]|uniref:SpcZ n=1 Tax=Micromonospora nigra TaxID=145857 RepID=A0A1C6RBV8_9ACTN|nr:hypothetical protein [Micromonospora nigra]SCL14472.1 hypothetical protein GA0070616_0450 [Micromonospora nigra]
MSEPPAWLTAVLAALAEGHETAPAHWRRRVDAELDRLAGRVPFRVVYDWHARVLASTPDGDAGRPVGDLFRRALAGDRAGAHEWHAALRPALRGLYRAAYPYADARSVAYANAHAYATANGYGPDEAVEFAAHYADLSTGANAEAFADANAIANADALGTALARADGPAYALTYPAALVRAYAMAAANRAGATGTADELRAAYGRLVDALAESLRDVPG